jgi:bifunctional enzyme CysN/CysC
MSWHDGPTLLEHLETIEIADERANAPFRLPVQWVNRPNLDFRGFSGTDHVWLGQARRRGRRHQVGQDVKGQSHRHGRWRPAASSAGEAVTLVIADEIDASRGDIFASPDARPEVSNQFTANILWMTEEELTTGHAIS